MGLLRFGSARLYRLKPGIKSDPVRRWALPDRVFFGHGACHILAGVYLRDRPLPDFWAERIIPKDAAPGNHIYVTDGRLSFDYHGYASRVALLAHHTRSWRRMYGPGWAYDLERVAFDLLDTKALNARAMRGPDQYLGNATARAEAFVARIDHARTYQRAVPQTG